MNEVQYILTWDIFKGHLHFVSMPSPIHTPQYQAFLIRLRTARKRARLTQSEVALRLKKPQSYVSKCESGERRIDATEVVAFADLYGVSIEELVRGPLTGE